MYHKARRVLAVFLILMHLLITGVSTAKADSTPITLQSAEFITGKGFVLKFQVTPKFDPKKVDKFILINSVKYKLDCHRQNDILTCVAEISRKQFGNHAIIWIGKYSFGATIKEPRQSYCYNIIDYDLSGVWERIGTYCQDHVARIGEAITFYNPEWFDYFDYIYTLDGSDAFCSGDSFFPAPDLGNGYYYFCRN